MLLRPGCERTSGSGAHARSGRHAVVRGGAELPPGFRGRSEHVRLARAFGQYAAGAAGLSRDRRALSSAHRGEKGDSRSERFELHDAPLEARGVDWDTH
jgi:hypothetical protein